MSKFRLGEYVSILKPVEILGNVLMNNSSYF